MSNFNNYTEMKKEGTVKLSKNGENITLKIQQRHPRTGNPQPDLIQNVTIKALENNIESLGTEKKRIKERCDEQIKGVDKRIANIELLMKDAEKIKE